MNLFATVLLAVLSIWDYPARQSQHEKLRSQFVRAIREGDIATMEETCRKGVALLPDDSVWHYNLACALAYFERQEPALEELEKAIDLGFRDAEHIAKDHDFERLAKNPRFGEMVEYARQMKGRPLPPGPQSFVAATGVMGKLVAIGEQNLSWNFDAGCFEASLKLASTPGDYAGILYFNRDRNHSRLPVENFAGLTEVVLDEEGRQRGMDLNLPNMCFPYPLVGNCSRAYTSGPFWRSLPRAMMTTESTRLKVMHRLYLANQLWVFPAVYDTPPAGTNGDVFASMTPYWVQTQGKSWSDQYYVREALETMTKFQPLVRAEIVKRRMMAPTIVALFHHALRGVKGEEDYLSPAAHPTAMPPKGLDTERLYALAASIRQETIPPQAVFRGLALSKPQEEPLWSELTYSLPCAAAIVLRADDTNRVVKVQAAGGEEFRFVQTHGDPAAAKIEVPRPGFASITIDRTKVGPVNRVDISVFARNPGSLWGAPAIISVAVMDPSAPYADPALTPRR